MKRQKYTQLTDREFAQFTANARLMAFTILRKVRRAREAVGMSQAELSARVGVTQSTISEWESGVVMPQLDSLMRICVVLEIPFQFGALDTP